VQALGEEAAPPDAAPLHVLADLTTNTDVDVYSYRATNRTAGFQVRLQTSAVGLLAAG